MNIKTNFENLLGEARNKLFFIKEVLEQGIENFQVVKNDEDISLSFMKEGKMIGQVKLNIEPTGVAWNYSAIVSSGFDGDQKTINQLLGISAAIGEKKMLLCVENENIFLKAAGEFLDHSIQMSLGIAAILDMAGMIKFNLEAENDKSVKVNTEDEILEAEFFDFIA